MLDLSKYKVVLASNSPRRKELLAGLDLDYEIKVLCDIDESFPDYLQGEDIAIHVAKKKADAYHPEDNTLLITADTIVLLEGKVYGKPENEDDAKQMLRDLSGKTHTVATGVCITTKEKQQVFGVTSEVRFAKLQEDEIEYYVTKYKPLDKAGAYGVQEWIGYIAVEYISGSYYNIMGLPIQRLYHELKQFLDRPAP
ncbi:Maf-like protein [Dysgonomonas reticulitermitis]